MSDKEFEKHVWIRPAFDRRDPDPSKNYGIHGAEFCFILQGSKGATQFVLYTNWQLPHVEEENMGGPWPHGRNAHDRLHCRPIPADLGYHSPHPMYEDHSIMDTDCQFVEGGNCYYDGSSLAAERVFREMLEDGHEGIWRNLLKVYLGRFEDGSETGDMMFGEMLNAVLGSLPQWNKPKKEDAN